MSSGSTPYEKNLNNLIGNPPGWLLKSGLTVLAIILLLFCCVARLVHYPDKVTCAGQITSLTPPIEIIANGTGIIDELFVKSGGHVDAGDTVLCIRNTAEPTDMNYLLNIVRDITNAENPSNIEFSGDLNVGELQSYFASLVLSYAEYRQLLEKTGPGKEAVLIQNQIENLKLRRAILKRQQELALTELELKEKGFNRTKILHDEGVISNLDLEAAKIEIIQFEKQYENAANGVLSNMIEEEQLNQNLHKVLENRVTSVSSEIAKLKEHASVILLKIKEWQKQFLVLADIEGELVINSELAVNSPIQLGNHIAYIKPYNSVVHDRYIKAEVPASGIGKIEKDDKAIVKVVGYPYKEYGVLISKVGEIGAVPLSLSENSIYYEVKIILPQEPMTTQYGEIIPFMPNAPVNIDIITDDKSLLGRIFNQFSNLIKNQ